MEVEPKTVMSDLYSAGSSGPGRPDQVESRLIERLKHCQRLAVDLIRPEFEGFIQRLDEALLDAADNAKTNQVQAEYFAMQRRLRQESEVFTRAFLAFLAEGFIKFKNHQLQTTTGEERYQGDMLSLVDNDDLEETIAISSITHRAESHFAEPLWCLNQRLSVVNGGEKVADRTNPLGPIQYCHALRRAFQPLELDTKAKIMAYKLFDQSLIPRLGETLAQVNGYLQQEGILANLRYTPVSADTRQAPSAAAGAGTAAPVNLPDGAGTLASAETAPDQYQGRLVDAIRLLQGHLAQLGGGNGGSLVQTGAAAGSVSVMPASGGEAGNVPSAGVNHAGATYSAVAQAGGHGSAAGSMLSGAAGGGQQTIYTSQQLVDVLGGLQQQAFIGAAGAGDSAGHPLPVQAVSAVSQQLLMQLRADAGADTAAMAVDEMQTIDLVGMLFEYMLSDDNLPDSIKALLSYLHTPFLKVAFLDKNFFEQTEHPARLLLNSLAEAGARWVGNDGSDQFDIYNKIKSTVSRILEEFKNDVRLMAELLLEFSSYTRNIQRRQELVERRAMEKVQGEEKLREVKQQVNQVVRARTDGRELPSAVLLLLLQPWSDFLAFTLLRYGDQSERWQRAVRAVDEVLWSVQPKMAAHEKIQQEQMQASLLSTIETGFETIGYDQAKGKKLLEALASLQKMALKSRQIEAAPQPMRAKLESLAAEKAGEMAANLVNASPQEAKMVENLKMIEFGTWLEFDGGKRLKVAWYNSKTSHYMLVDQMGKKVAMKSGLELARDMLGGRARVIAGSTKPFFERALENIFQSLNKKAETITAGVQS